MIVDDLEKKINEHTCKPVKMPLCVLNALSVKTVKRAKATIIINKHAIL